MLTINNLTYRIGGRLLLDAAGAQIPTGKKIGLVGRNGAGKSTLLKLILGELAPEGGSISVPARSRIGTVAQDAPRGEASLVEIVLAADTERTELLAAAETSTDPHRIAEVHERLNQIDAHSAPARAATILAGLGFDEATQARPIGAFSGGWRMRVALAAALFRAPDLLLLDEPTNHLDLEATIWLESYLANYPHTLLLVSHDRNLLNRVAEGILHLENTTLTLYSGNYDRFERTRREAIQHQAALREKQEAERAHIQKFIDRFRAKATKARQAQSRIKMLEKMEPIVPVIESAATRFDFPDPQELPPPLITTDGASVGYEPDKPILRGLTLRIDMDDRIALLGANGNGKSTLLRLLTGSLDALEGKVTRARKLTVGYFAQDQLELLDPTHTALQHMALLMGNPPEQRVRAHLGRFGFVQSKAEVRISNLSGGEKARLVLAGICREAPQILLLDEPTNHLDIEAREALVRALNAYGGAVVLVTHDPHLIELAADRLWLVADGRCEPFDDDLDAYRRLLMEQRRSERRAQKDSKADDDKPRRTKQDDRRARADARAAVAHLRKAAKEAELRHDRLMGERARLEGKLADPSLYDGPPDKMAELARRKAEVEREIEAAEEAWLEAEARLEAVQ